MQYRHLVQTGFNSVSNVLSQAGQIVFDNLSLLFAVGVAVGLAGGDGVAGIAAIVGYLIMNKTMSTILVATGQLDPDKMGANPAYTSILGIPTLATGVFGGIIVGILASSMYNRYFNIELPSYFRVLCRKTICTNHYWGIFNCFRCYYDFHLAANSKRIKCFFY